ncbi:hypothetical protein B1748_28760 [Paenibacillus sp. MY03]|uniref:DUF6259 domain-containing protein n=1 Tax=Paenibacillus sp. MY03 TaxID=302980 RepID=UPI000B3C2D4F|nr:DUF6259 domain-containing protein [Paenibacillus sp. MY03]OUS70232.1 hypothetical protein B1748_28760 [Paenibacillus sp. MY03]
MQHKLENDYIAVTFDESSLGIVSLLNKETGDDCVKHEQVRPLLALWTSKRGETGRPAGPLEGIRLLSCQSAATADGSKMLELTFEADPGGIRSSELGGAVSRELDVAGGNELGGAVSNELDGGGGNVLNVPGRKAAIGAVVRIRLAPASGECYWSLELRNEDADYDVTEVLFPYLGGMQLGSNRSENQLVYPHHAGEKIGDPVLHYASDKYMNFWRAQSFRSDDCYYREINYCGLASMTWMYLHDRKQGLYFSSHDERFPLTGLRVETGGPEEPWLGLSFRKFPQVGTGEKWHSGEYCLALTNCDWHWGAKRYRQWIDGHIAMPEHPSFLQDEYVLHQCYNFKRQENIDKRFADIPAMYDQGKSAFDMRHMLLASWNRKGFDRDYPEFQPDMELGTPWELYEGCSYVKEQNGFVTFYINARIFDVDSDFFPTLGRRWAIKDQEGGMMHEEYGPNRFVALCPSHDEWQNYLLDMSRWMVRSYGATGIYLDQLGSADPYPCYDSGHSHIRPDEFNTGYLRVLRKLLPEMRKMNPDSFLMIENCGDIYGSHVWGNLTWNGEKYDEFFNLYKYTFPEYVQINMVNPRRGLSGSEQYEQLRRDTARAMLLGAIFWIGMDKFKDADDITLRFMEQAVKLRGKLQPFVRQGVYVDDDGIAFIRASETVKVSHWILQDGGHLYVIDNLSKATGYFEVEAASVGAVGESADDGGLQLWKAELGGDEGEVSWQWLDGRLRMALPESELSCIVVNAR